MDVRRQPVEASARGTHGFGAGQGGTEQVARRSRRLYFLDYLGRVHAFSLTD